MKYVFVSFAIFACMVGVLFANVDTGRDLLRQGKTVEAVLQFRKALLDDSKNIAAHAGLAMAMYSLARYEEVMTVFPEEIKKGNIDLNKRDQDAFNILKMIGFASFKNQQSKKAIIALSIAIKIRDDDPSIYNTLGLAYLNTGSLRLSEIAFRTAVNLDQSNHIYINNMGAAYLEQKMHRDALLCFEKAVRMEPKYLTGWGNVWTSREKMNLPSMRGQYTYSYFLTATEEEKKQAAIDIAAKQDAEKRRQDALVQKKKAEEEAKRKANELKIKEEERKRLEEEKKKRDELLKDSTNTTPLPSIKKTNTITNIKTNALPVVIKSSTGSTN
jgi:tetratricopeptide (TPR) repeat protein